METERICIFYYPDDITVYHSLFPILTSARYRADFTLVADPDYVLNQATEARLLLMRLHKRPELYRNEEFFHRVRERFEKVYYFDDVASADSINTFAFPFVDLYFKKQLYTDRSLYTRKMYGKRLFADYYHRSYGIVDEHPEIRPALAPENVNKLRLSWNLGIGCYPKSRNRNRALRRLYPSFGLASLRPFIRVPRRRRTSENRSPVLSARYNLRFDKASVAHHRTIYQPAVDAHSGILSGRVSLRDYSREMATAAAAFSPFGWGEICFRDFEAMIYGAVLVKPTVEHLETWPDLFRPGETYLPVDWDAKNFRKVVDPVLEDPAAFRPLAHAAAEAFHGSYSRLDERLEQFLREVYSA